MSVRQAYTHTLKKLGVYQRLRNHPKNRNKALKADRKVKTIAGRLVRELERNLSPGSVYQNDLDIFYQVLAKKRDNREKIYPIFESHTEWITKGKLNKGAKSAKTTSGLRHSPRPTVPWRAISICWNIMASTGVWIKDCTDLNDMQD